MSLAERFGRSAADERGVAALLIALSLVVLLGMVAFSVDFGVLVQEKRELQTGAESAALAIALECADGGCPADPNGMADEWIDRNASDGEGRVAAGVAIDESAGTVTVVAGSLNNGNDRDGDVQTADVFFAPVIGHDGLDVQASATAVWGAIGGAGTLPLTFGQCEWAQAGGDLSGTLPTGQMVIGFHFGTSGTAVGNPEPDEDPCFFNNGQDVDPDEDRLPGGFGWLQQESCETDLSVDLYVDAKTGNATPQGCSPEDLGLVIGDLILMPMFDNIPDGGSKKYHIVAFVGIRVQGFKFPGNASIWRQGETGVCSTLGPGNSQSCIVGTAEAIFEPDAVTGGPSTGATTTALVG